MLRYTKAFFCFIWIWSSWHLGSAFCSQDLGLSEASGRHGAGHAANFTVSGKKGRNSTTCWQWRLEAQKLVKNDRKMTNCGSWQVDRQIYDTDCEIHWVQKLLNHVATQFGSFTPHRSACLRPGLFCSHCQSWLSCSSALPSCSTTSRCLRVWLAAASWVLMLSRFQPSLTSKFASQRG